MSIERTELEIVLRGVVATLREVADELDDLLTQNKKSEKLSKELKKILGRGFAAMILTEDFRQKLTPLLPLLAEKAKRVSPSPRKFFKKTPRPLCSECQQPHSFLKSCDTEDEEE